MTTPEFGRRHPLPPAPYDPDAQKRSRHVILLLMGTLAVGGGAYALMTSESTCDPTRPTIPGEKYECPQNTSSSGGGHGYGGSSHSSLFSSNSSSSSGGDAGGATSGSHVSRGGFGGFGVHFSGGG